jgi:hypothetical protein
MAVHPGDNRRTAADGHSFSVAQVGVGDGEPAGPSIGISKPDLVDSDDGTCGAVPAK